MMFESEVFVGGIIQTYAEYGQEHVNGIKAANHHELANKAREID
jgi:hypothetical protein